jgi:putative cell wall-binding protein
MSNNNLQMIKLYEERLVWIEETLKITEKDIIKVKKKLNKATRIINLTDMYKSIIEEKIRELQGLPPESNGICDDPDTPYDQW